MMAEPLDLEAAVERGYEAIADKRGPFTITDAQRVLSDGLDLDGSATGTPLIERMARAIKPSAWEPWERDHERARLIMQDEAMEKARAALAAALGNGDRRG
jgi:hypothetical protein